MAPMAYIFRLPDIGDGLTEADIVRWHAPVGAAVGADEVLVEVETAKAVVDIPSPAAGTVLHHGAGEGATLPVGAVLAVIGEPGEAWQDQAPDAAAGGGGPSGPAEGASGVAGPGRGVKALPVVRRLARELGVDLAAVSGAGPGGRITREDVMAAAAAPPSAGRPGKRRRLSMLRRTIAGHMSASWREIPHVTVFDRAAAGRLLAARKALAVRHGRNIPMEALVIMAAAPALRRHREFNATLEGDELILHRDLHAGIAVDTEEGLLVPVIRRAGEKGLLELAQAVNDIAARGKARTLGPGELTGATFTFSNFGALGGSHGTPIIPSGTTAVLALGRAAEAPVVRDGAVAVDSMMPLSLAFDHRVIDGGLGQRFLRMLIENLEEPALFLAD